MRAGHQPQRPQKHLNTSPNEAFGYSNSNYNLFAIIVERVSGMTLTGKDQFSTDNGGFSGEKGEIVFFREKKQLFISVSLAKGVIFNKL